MGAGASSSAEEASSSPEIGEPSSRPGALPQGVGVSLTGMTPAITPGDAHSTTTGAAPDVPHHETASTRPNPRVEDTFDNTHATGASGTTPPTTCLNFTCTERDPFRISEELLQRNVKMPSDSRISIACNHWNRNYRSWDLQSIFAWDLRSSVIWITIAHRSNCIWITGSTSS